MVYNHFQYHVTIYLCEPSSNGSGSFRGHQINSPIKEDHHHHRSKEWPYGAVENVSRITKKGERGVKLSFPALWLVNEGQEVNFDWMTASSHLGRMHWGLQCPLITHPLSSDIATELKKMSISDRLNQQQWRKILSDEGRKTLFYLIY